MGPPFPYYNQTSPMLDLSYSLWKDYGNEGRIMSLGDPIMISMEYGKLGFDFDHLKSGFHKQWVCVHPIKMGEEPSWTFMNQTRLN